MTADEDRSSWCNHPSVRDMYLLGLCHRRDVASLRDLRAKHLPMLRAMRDVGLATIERVYGVQANRVKCFVHYPPQFYHFHVHYTARLARVSPRGGAMM
jgi:m7GpppX diphosphatase